MATYLEIYDLWTSSSMKKRATVAVAKSAQYILVEDPATTNHAARLDWAKSALKDPVGTAGNFMWAVAGNATIQTAGEACPDTDIQYVVDANIDAFAAGV